MSINFHANQYEQGFDPKRIQNWEVPKSAQGKYPDAREGFSNIKANGRGHLLSGVPRSRESPWGGFVGTWDLPTKIPGNKQLNPTARSEDAQLKLQVNKADAAEVMCGGLKKCKIPSPLPVRIDEDARPENNPPYVQAPSPPGPKPPTPNAFVPTKGRMTPPTFPMNGNQQVTWPMQNDGDADKPVGNPCSPKAPTPMNLGGDAVQREAAARVSPVNPEQVAVKGAVATPVEPMGAQMRTPEADVNWPLARSCEPPEC